ncbi:histidine utilization repressor [Agrococcus sp. KRD186]|uniref:histidine utilization repressor n=1 Tax=Agrococcus sp. KRD186 TaxID=2729730 RepID=UPI0019D06A25|nr:histidine utilization repressor [Agrococcus sp. KRD186]
MQVDTASLAREFEATGGDGTPAYERIKRVISDRIRTGKWGEGERLPSEHQLVAALGISRMTVNRALRELADSGAIVRSMGVGSFVAETRAVSPLLEVRNIADEVQRRGHRHSTRLISLAAEDADDRPFAADSMTDRVYRSVIVHFEDDTAIQLEDRLVNPALVPEYLQQDFTSSTPNDYLSRVAPLTRTQLVIEAVLPTDEQAAVLGIESHEPCLQIRRSTWSAEGLVSVVRLTQPGARSRLEGGFDS